MFTSTDLRELARKERDNADRAPQLARMLSALSNHNRLWAYAAELEREAEELELEAQSNS